MTTANEALFDAIVRHQHYIERFKGGLSKRLIELLNEVDADLVKQIIKLDPTTGRSSRLTKLLALIRELNKDAVKAYDNGLKSEIKQLSEYEAAWMVSQLEKNVPIIDFLSPSPTQLEAAITARPFQGRFLKDWVSDLEAARLSRLEAAIRIGVVEGESINDIVARVRGTRALNYSDGVLQISRRGAEALTRTAVNHTVSVARELVYDDNQDVLKGIQWRSTLDSRTSAICQSRDGQIYPVGKGPRPPAHIACRSTTAPITKSWQELGFDGGELDVGTRSSLNGEVPANLNYNDWLSRQPASFQDDVLGPTRGKLFRNGGLTLDKFVDDTGRRYTLDELRKIDPEAFRRAA